MQLIQPPSLNEIPTTKRIMCYVPRQQVFNVYSAAGGGATVLKVGDYNFGPTPFAYVGSDTKQNTAHVSLLLAEIHKIVRYTLDGGDLAVTLPRQQVRKYNMHSETADFAPGAATWRTGRNILLVFHSGLLPLL